MKKGRPITKESKKIIRYLKAGRSWYWIHKVKGFKRNTCIYYSYKLFKPEKYLQTVAKVNALNIKNYRALHSAEIISQ